MDHIVPWWMPLDAAGDARVRGTTVVIAGVVVARLPTAWISLHCARPLLYEFR